MRIILSMPSDGQSNNYIINALQDLGHDVVSIDHRTHLQAAMKQLPDMVKYFKPDMFLCLYLVDGNTYPKEFIERLQVQSPQTTFACWLFDITINGENAWENKPFIDLIRAYDYFFTVDKSHVDNFKKKNINAYWVPEGFCPYSHCFQFDGDQETDVAFVGQFGSKEVHSDRLDYLDAICDLGLKVKIYGVAQGMTKNIEKSYMHRPTVNDVEHCRVVSSSKINICHSGWPDVEKYVSARNYRVSAAGGFMMANKSVGASSIWEDGKEIVLYDSVKDCIDKIRYYLDNDNKRMEIAAAGMNKTLNNYSFVDSMTKILDITD